MVYIYMLKNNCIYYPYTKKQKLMEKDTINLKDYGEIHWTVKREKGEKENDVIILQSQKIKGK